MTSRATSPFRLITSAWRRAADECRTNAHTSDNGLSWQSKAIFAGRSDGYLNCADTLDAMLDLIDHGPSAELRETYYKSHQELERNCSETEER